MKRLAEITRRYVGRPFADVSCMGLLHALYTEMGIAVPDAWGELTLENYMNLYRADRKAAEAALLALLDTLGAPVSAPYKIGDLLAVSQPVHDCIYPAVYLGRGLAITSTVREGVTVYPLGPSNKPVAARRLA